MDSSFVRLLQTAGDRCKLDLAAMGRYAIAHEKALDRSIEG